MSTPRGVYWSKYGMHSNWITLRSPCMSYHLVWVVIVSIVVQDSDEWSNWHGDNRITRNTLFWIPHLPMFQNMVSLSLQFACVRNAAIDLVLFHFKSNYIHICVMINRAWLSWYFVAEIDRGYKPLLKVIHKHKASVLCQKKIQSIFIKSSISIYMHVCYIFFHCKIKKDTKDLNIHHRKNRISSFYYGRHTIW